MTSLDSVPESSFMTADNSLLFNEQSQNKMAFSVHILAGCLVFKVLIFRRVLLVQSCGHIDASLLSTASHTPSGHVRRFGEHVE